MNANMGETKRKISEALGHSVGARVLRVLALGALLAGATALYFSVSQGDAGSTSFNRDTLLAYPDTPYYQDPDWRGEVAANTVEDMAESPSGEVSRNFFGIPASGGETFQEWEVEELEAPVIGIPAPAGGSRPGDILPAWYISPEWQRVMDREELIRDYDAMGIRWRLEEPGNIVELPGKTGETTSSIDDRFPPGILPED